MGTKSFTDDGESISDINVVPLVDIILVVLIIFMVTAPMIMKPSINVALPKTSTGDPTKPGGLQISLSADGRMSLNNEPSDLEKIRQKAVSELAANPEVQAVISADKSVAHGQVVAIIDLVKKVGVKKFAISIEKQAGQ
ncbi:MAG: biopolymer transporter ExbD [Bdellovibrio sp.]|nr:MAG: biopolymer transporter ExbD [Bdellovibrio sp.]